MFIASLVLLPVLSFAAETSHHLFKPVPQDSLRAFDADRPSRTASPFTLDAGHFQVEADFANYTVEGEAKTLNVIPLNLRAGILSDLDFQVSVTPYYTKSVSSEYSRGFGDVGVKARYNLWGNSGSDSALTIAPFARVLTSRENFDGNAVFPGVSIPLMVTLPKGFRFYGMGEITLAKLDGAVDRHTELATSAMISRSIIPNVTGFVELYNLASSLEGTSWITTADAGAAYAITADAQIDVAVNFGISAAADDVSTLIGGAVRF